MIGKSQTKRSKIFATLFLVTLCLMLVQLVVGEPLITLSNVDWLHTPVVTIAIFVCFVVGCCCLNVAFKKKIGSRLNTRGIKVYFFAFSMVLFFVALVMLFEISGFLGWS